MKKMIPNGPRIKQLRCELERCSTQKELSHAAGISERKLRDVENANAPIDKPVLQRLAERLGVHLRDIACAPVQEGSLPAVAAGLDLLQQLVPDGQVVPRHDTDLARATMDGAALFKEASSSAEVVCEIKTTLTEETAAYAQELMEILTSLSYARRSILDKLPPTEEIATRRRIRQLLVLLKGNDVWVYQTNVLRRLPERYTLPPKDEPFTFELRLVLAFAPPGEYGETSVEVAVDHGQPFVLQAFAPPPRALEA